MLKKLILVPIIIGIMLSLGDITPAWAGEIDILVDKLVEKGILSPNEAKIILAETKQEAVKEKTKSGDMDVLWKDGLRIQTEDKKVELKIGGRVYADAGWMSEDSGLKEQVGKLNDTAEFRTARIYTEGTFLNNFIFKAEYDFAGGDADFKDVYLGYKGIPYLGTLKIGHFKEPFSLEELTSSRFITFMERSLGNAFVPGRNIGAALNNAFLGDAKHPRLTWAVGLFRDANDFGNAAFNEWNFTTRVTGLPWYEDDGRKLLHIGAAYSYRPPHATVRYRTRPESHMAAYFIDTGNIPAKNSNLIGLEAALVYGPFSLQGELMQAFVDRTNGINNFYAGYGQVSYFLTGENRVYKNSSGAFDRVRPKNDFNLFKLIDGDWTALGAWEMAGRWSGINLLNHDIDTGILHDTTIGLNWYLNPNMRIMANYIHSNRNGIGYADLYQMRFQYDF